MKRRKEERWGKSNQCMIYIHKNVITKLTILYNENVLIFKNDPWDYILPMKENETLVMNMYTP